MDRYAETGAEPTWETCQTKETELPPPPPWWAVILPGLGDGINPCAFATIIFFVSYLSLIERKGRDILLVGHRLYPGCLSLLPGLWHHLARALVGPDRLDRPGPASRS